MARIEKSDTENETDDGSISPLISIYFVIIMSSIFILSNIAMIYIARRELINLTESSLAVAAQELDKESYYYQVPSPAWITNSHQFLVPIDCKSAASVFQREIQYHASGRGSSSRYTNTNMNSTANSVRILNFQCDGRTLQARVINEEELPFTFPAIGMKSFSNVIEVGISTTYLT